MELELAGTTVALVLTGLAQYLGHCGVCREEYETFHDFGHCEAEEVPPQPEGLVSS